MPSTLLAYQQVVSRRFASRISVFPQLTVIFGLGSIPGSFTTKQQVKMLCFPNSSEPTGGERCCPAFTPFLSGARQGSPRSR